MGKKVFGEVTPAQLFDADDVRTMLEDSVSSLVGNWSAAYMARHGKNSALMDIAERARALYHYDREITDAIDELMTESDYQGMELTSMYNMSFRYGIIVSLHMMRLGSSALMPVMVDQGLPIPMINMFGSDAIIDRVLAKTRNEKWHGGYAQTEPGAGSYLAAITTRAVKQDDGTFIIPTGEKAFISNAPIANYFTVLVITDPDAHATSEHAGMSWLYVEATASGLTVSDPNHKLGIHQSPTGSVFFDDTPGVLIGEEGDGWNMAMQILQRSRNWVGVQGTGLSLLALDVAEAYMDDRNIGPYSLADLPDPQKKFLQIRARYVASRLLVELAAEAFDSCEGESYHAYDVDASLAKMFGTERGVESVRLAKEILGGMGYSNETPIPEALTFAEVTGTYEGPAATQRQIIAGKGFSRLMSQLKADGVDVKKLKKANPKFVAELLDTYSVDWPMSRLVDASQPGWLMTTDPGDTLTNEYEGLSYRLYQLRRRYLITVFSATPIPSMKEAVKGIPKFYANYFSPMMPAFWHDIAEALTALEAATVTVREYHWNSGEGISDLPILIELVEMAEEAMDTAEKQLAKNW